MWLLRSEKWVELNGLREVSDGKGFVTEGNIGRLKRGSQSSKS